MPIKTQLNALNRTRRAGVLLHPTSLPGPMSSGDIGHQAYRFIEFLHKYGFKVWQMLPLGPTHSDKSPYQCLSAHAGNPLLISLDWLEDKGWLDKTVIHKDDDDTYRLACLRQAADTFYTSINDFWKGSIAKFSQQNASWLDDYSLFMSFKQKYDGLPWYEWPDEIRHRDAEAIEDAKISLEEQIKYMRFEQFVFFTQWHEIREYAKKHQVELFGDMPIFVARDSCDVWAQRDNFLMDADGEMEFISGVPPDAFSDTGQRWGNPLYDWDYMQSTQFNWWKDRFSTQLELFDIIRIDHFRGLQACWQIPQEDKTAINGQWVEVPGREMLEALYESFKELPLIAEDLGVITEPVIELKNHFKLPGMKVLQFAFDGNNANPHLPHRHQPDDVVYTGTHDNDTSFGWAGDKLNYNKLYFNEYVNSNSESAEDRAYSLIRLSMASVSFLSVMPMQDLLMLDSSARMNVPGTVGANWEWRFKWSQLRTDVLDKTTHLMSIYQR